MRSVDCAVPNVCGAAARVQTHAAVQRELFPAAGVPGRPCTGGKVPGGDQPPAAASRCRSPTTSIRRRPIRNANSAAGGISPPRDVESSHRVDRRYGGILTTDARPSYRRDVPAVKPVRRGGAMRSTMPVLVVALHLLGRMAAHAQSNDPNTYSLSPTRSFRTARARTFRAATRAPTAR
jgi:hypothetical protein